MTRNVELLATARAEALFLSDISAHARPTRAVVTAAIRRVVRTYGSTRACAAEMAAAYGEHPECAAARMQWARSMVSSVYAERPVAPLGLDRRGRAA